MAKQNKTNSANNHKSVPNDKRSDGVHNLSHKTSWRTYLTVWNFLKFALGKVLEIITISCVKDITLLQCTIIFYSAGIKNPF